MTANTHTRHGTLPARSLMADGFHQHPVAEAKPGKPACSRCGDRGEIEVDGFRPTATGGEERVIVVGSCPDCGEPQPAEIYPYRPDFDLAHARRAVEDRP